LPYPARIDRSHRFVFGSRYVQTVSPVFASMATTVRRWPATV
jgi:hypothetical protein